MRTEDTPAPSIDRGTYRHSKTGKMYEVLGVALHTEAGDFLVVYRAMYDSNYEYFARPYEMFVELVELDGKTKPRFQKVDPRR